MDALLILVAISYLFIRLQSIQYDTEHSRKMLEELTERLRTDEQKAHLDDSPPEE